MLSNQPLLIFYLITLIISAAQVITLAVIGTKSAEKHDSDSDISFEIRRLYFAACMLTGLGLIFVLSMGMYYFSPNIDPSLNGESAGQNIFDAVKTVVPPIATLMLGYYFGSSSQKKAVANKANSADAKSHAAD